MKSANMFATFLRSLFLMAFMTSMLSASEVPTSTAWSADTLRIVCSNLFAVERTERGGFNTLVSMPEEGNLLYSLAQKHELFLDYLVDHCGFDISTLPNTEDSVELNRAFHERLRGHAELNACLLPVLTGYLKKQGITVRDVAATTLDTSAWTWAEVMPLASRFVYIDGRDSARQLQTHVCTGENGVVAYSERKNVWVEAMVFEAIMNDLFSEDSQIYPEFLSFAKSVNLVATSDDSTTAVLQVREAMFGLVEKSAVFKNVINEAYTNMSYLIPLKISE